VNGISIFNGDCLERLKQFPDNYFDLCITSPPYEAARTYGELGFSLRGQEWVDWAIARYVECVRVTKGLVAWVMEGQTRQYQWSATPALLMADLHRRGFRLRKPPVFHRVGIPGSGGPDWLRNDYEFIVCSSKGRLPWSDNTAMGHPPKYAPGGDMSHRTKKGDRVGKMAENATEPKAVAFLNGDLPAGSKLHTKSDGTSKRVQCYTPPAKANPGNVIKCSVGGGRMGHPLAHENEAPFPTSLVEFFVKSFCPPGGTIIDPFCGSGTTLQVGMETGRNVVGIDIRDSQTILSQKRLDSLEKGQKDAKESN
jgi:site-specific DNA-methyltransferase (adenine-specific)/site-specific DNA-methyltransferase (cytosine-N4-specific)